MLIVQKYGGSSLADTERIYAAARRTVALCREGHRVVTVVSAQADTTDALIAQAARIAPQSPGREMDMLLSVGEQSCAALTAMAINALGWPAVSLTGWQAGLRTDSVWGNARILCLTGNRLRQELDQGNTVVVTGFQGVDEKGEITTLGRGGSDTTAVALAAFLQADLCRIYTDVDGVYDKDPRKYPQAVRYRRIGYDHMLRLCRQGAQVLHDRSVELAREHGLPVEVCSAFTDGPGTLVG